MYRNLLYKVTVSGMFLVGGLGIVYFIYALFIPSPTIQETEYQPQLSEAHTRQTVGRVSEENRSKTPLDPDLQATELSVSSTDSPTTEEREPPSSPSPTITSDESEVTVRIKELETQLEEYTQKLDNLHEQRKEIFKLSDAHDKTPEEIELLINRLQNGEVSSEREALAIIERLKQLSHGPTSRARAKELERMFDENIKEISAISEQRRAVEAELDFLRRLTQEEEAE